MKGSDVGRKIPSSAITLSPFRQQKTITVFYLFSQEFILMSGIRIELKVPATAELYIQTGRTCGVPCV